MSGRFKYLYPCLLFPMPQSCVWSSCVCPVSIAVSFLACALNLTFAFAFDSAGSFPSGSFCSGSFCSCFASATSFASFWVRRSETDHAHTLLGGEQTEFTTFLVATVDPANSFIPTFSTNPSLSGVVMGKLFRDTKTAPTSRKTLGP